MEKEKNKPQKIDPIAVITAVKDNSARNRPYTGYPAMPVEKKQEEAANTEPDEKPETEEKTTPIRENNRKKKSEIHYRDTFIHPNEFKMRQCVYVSQEVHAILVKFMGAFPDKNITVGGFVNNVLLEHLERYKDEINELFQESKSNLL